MTPERMAALRDLYARVEAECAGLGGDCRACGACCRFDEAEHILYASGLEREYLLAVSPPPAAPEDDDLRRLIALGRRCPYQRGNVCLARDGRVLGCRLHFCRGGHELAERAETWHRALAALHDRLGADWAYAPLLPLPAPDNTPAPAS